MSLANYDGAEAPPAEVVPVDPWMPMIERLALNPAVDADKLVKLYELSDRASKERARVAFNAAMAAAQSELPQVVRRAQNTQTNSTYATLEAIGDAIDPVITAHGFSQTFSTADGAPEGSIRVVCRLAHAGGFERDYQADVPVDATGIKGVSNKTKTHAFGSTISYGRRYLTMMIFNVKSQRAMPDDDGNAAGGRMRRDDEVEYASTEQIEHIKELIAETKSNAAQFLKACKVNELEDLTVAHYKHALTRFAEKKKDMANAAANNR